MRVFAILSLVLLLGGCATRMSVEDPFLTVVWGDAYTLECEGGELPAVGEDGSVTCPSGKSLEVRGGHIGETFGSIISGALNLVGGFLPRGVAAQ